ncbi:MAG TPA: adenylyl cyclase, partial [Balneola sp.]|nr:adenylyl cyclase [Balneola sp.]
MNISNFIEELKRRNVFKVAVAYAIAGWLIIQIVTVIEAPLNIPDWFDTVVIVLVGIGFPLTLIFAWAFELTPEGIKKSREVEITESVTDRTGKKLNGVIISVLSIALFFVVVERIFFAKASILEDAGAIAKIETASIAVLPFVNMSSDTENEYFSDGLSEELLNALAKVEDMQVAGRTSSFKFKGQ